MYTTQCPKGGLTVSYAESLLKCEFDFGVLAKKPVVQRDAPLGSCFTMCCKWAKALLEGPTTSPQHLKDMLEREIENIAPVHAIYIKETSASLPPLKRMEGYRNAIKAFHLTAPCLADGDEIPAFSTKPDDDLDWMGCIKGDMWCAVYMWSMQQEKPFAGILSDDKHSVGLFCPGDSFRIWDMNAGEFLVTGRVQWRTWCRGFEAFETKGKTLDKVQLIPVKR